MSIYLFHFMGWQPCYRHTSTEASPQLLAHCISQMEEWVVYQVWWVLLVRPADLIHRMCRWIAAREERRN